MFYTQTPRTQIKQSFQRFNDTISNKSNIPLHPTESQHHEKSEKEQGLLGNLLSGFVGAFLLLLFSEILSYYKKKKAEKEKYLNLLKTTKDELEFYQTKLINLESNLTQIISDLDHNRSPEIPTYNFYPSLTGKLKIQLSSYQIDSDLIFKITICHFELCHINERLNLYKYELRQDYDNSTMILNLVGFRTLIQICMTKYQEALLTINEIIKRRSQ